MPQNVLVSVLGEGEYLQKLINSIDEAVFNVKFNI